MLPLLLPIVLAVPAVSAQGPFSGCGTLTQGVTCVLFDADSGGQFVLDQLGPFVPSDRVQVTGTLDPTCFTICQQGNGCITVQTIVGCPTPPTFSECGTLLQDSFCMVFFPDAGGAWLPENTGSFASGARVQVTGTAVIHPTFCPSMGNILGNTIVACGPATSFCAGDGLDPTATTPCPCGNSGTGGRGCAHSGAPTGPIRGALLRAVGDVASDSVVLQGVDMPATAGAIYFKGDQSLLGAVVFGDGLRCVDGFLIRLGTKTNAGGASQYPEVGDPSLSVRGQTPVGSGLGGLYQVTYRNAASFCTPATFNASNALSIVW